MKKIILISFALLLSINALAQNKPCSGSKGGIAYCDGEDFVCKDGSISASKKICHGYKKKTNSSK